MYFGHKKFELNKWLFRLKIEKSPYWLTGFAPYFMIQLSKFHTKPPLDSVIDKSYYKGFYWEYTVPLHRLVIEVRKIRIAERNYVYWVDTFWDEKPIPKEKIEPNEYKCDHCGNIYEKGWSDEEAALEAEENFGKPQKDWKTEPVTVCDDCYLLMYPPDHPEEVEEVKKLI